MLFYFIVPKVTLYGKILRERKISGVYKLKKQYVFSKLT